MTKATFKLRDAFGQVRAYPTNEAAMALCALMGTKTLISSAISTIEVLGFQCVDCCGHPISPADLY